VHVQSVQFAEPGAASGVLSLSGVGAGHTILAGIRLSNSSDVLTSLTDSIDGAMTSLANVLSATAGSVRSYVRAIQGCSAGNHDITLSLSAAKSFRWWVAEYSESAIDTFSALVAFASGTSITGPSVSPSVAGGTLIGIISTDSTTTIAPNNGETERQEVNTALQFEDLALAGLGPYTPKWTLGSARAGLAMSIVMKGTPLVTRADHTALRGLGRGMFRGY
jgi:hypothetical protein